jgi:DNA polymerase-3 subunit gamma/tau
MRLMRLLAAGDARGLIEVVREIDEQFPDYARLLDDLARDLQRVAVYQVVGTCDCDDELTEQEIAELSQIMPAGDVQLFYQTAIMGRRDLHLAPDPRSGAEMTLMRMLAFKPASAGTSGAAASGPASRGAAATGRAAPTGAAGPKKSAAKTVAKPETPESDTADVKAVAWEEPDWKELVVSLGLSGAVRLLASNCAYLRREANTVYLGLDPRSAAMLTSQRKDMIASKLGEYFGERLNVDIAMGSETEETPLQQESRMADERLEEARQSLEADPNVQKLKDMFGAELKTDTIEIISGDKG